MNIVYEVIQSGPLSLSAPNAFGSNYLMMADGGDNT